MTKARKTRSDSTLKSFAKKNGLSEQSFRHKNGRKIRNDILIGTLRKILQKEKDS